MLKPLFYVTAALSAFTCHLHAADKGKSTRPNIVFIYADDWGRDAGVYADPAKPSPSDVVKTPNIDRVAKEGVRFNNAFYNCPQCAPSRGSLVSGCQFWRAGSEAILSGGDWEGRENPFDALPRFPNLLAENGYATGKAHKTLDMKPTLKLTPGPFKRYGLHLKGSKTPEILEKRRQEIIDQTRITMQQVLTETPPGKPFFFVFGPINIHRPFAPGSGKTLWGIEEESLKGKLPAFLPDVPEVRTDYADYLGEVQALDLMLGVFIEELEKAKVLDDTMIVLTGDNGVPGFPRGKTQLYDLGCRAPLIVRWPGKVQSGRTVDDFVSVIDLAPTFLEAGGVTPPAIMDAKSLLPLLVSKQSGTIDPARDAAIFGRERHAPNAREGNLPYPARAIRTKDYLFIRNFKPDRFPTGDPLGAGKENEAERSFLDIDTGFTKEWLIDHQADETGKPFYELAFGKRPEEELYHLASDPFQMKNVAASPEHQAAKKTLSARLLKVQQDTKDPRLEDAFDRSPYVGPNDGSRKAKPGRDKE